MAVHEAKHQQAVIKWSQQPSIRSRWPELALLYHIKNETPLGGAKQVAIDKAMGVKKGVPDLHLPVARGQYHGLYIEMKSMTGTAREAQRWWRDCLQAQGYAVKICRGWQAAVETIERYLSNE